MMYDQILKDLYPLSDSSLSELKSILRFDKVDKNTVFIKEGSKNSSEYILLKGYCRSYLLNPEGEEITLSFYKEKNVLSPHIVRTKQEIALLNFQALTDLDIIKFDAAQFLSLMISNIEIRDFGNTILKNDLIRKTDREIAFASLTAKERLANFRKEFAQLENLIPHPIIASYLGITNVSLSRLRADIKNK